MIVLHAASGGGRLVLWGEVPPGPATKRRGRARKAASAVAHPFEAGPARLAEALAGAAPDVPARAGDFATWAAWLPSTDAEPVASGPLIAEPPAPGSKTVVAPWAVSALALDAVGAVEVLVAARGRQTLAPGVVVGKDLEFWVAAFRFAGALVARQHFLPGLERAEGAYRARWEPVLVGADAQRVAQLARAMPSACRALSEDPAAGPPSTAPAAALSEFLGTMVDQLVRSSIADADTKAGRAQPRKAASFASIHDQWIHALRAPEGRIVADATELARLDEQVHQWRRPIDVEATAPFRLGFRLEEPEVPPDDPDAAAAIGEDGSAPWTVRYLLQATDDPSLLVPVAEAWEARGRQAALLRRGGFQPREALLAALGQASRISPRIEASLKESVPSGYVLDSAGAHAFLTRDAWMLEQAGFGVFLPAWWSRKGTKLRLGVRASVKSPKMTSKAGLSLDEVLDFRWEVALGDQVLSRAELEALARLKSPLVRVRGQWVQLSAEEIQAALDFWKAKGTELPARQALQMALGDAKVPGSLAFEGVRATGWFAELLGQLEGRAGFEALEPPEGFRGTLRPYQARGYAWLEFLRRWGLGACLADDMGLGKTVQTLAMIQRDWESRPRAKRRPTLLVCPTSVVGNWQKEAAKFTPELPVMVHHGLGRAKGAAFKKEAKAHALVLSSFGLLHRDFEALKAVPWAAVVLDEAQNIKNPQTKQAQAARALEAGHRVALTGTPVENHVGDLWSIMEFLNPGLLGTQAEFKRTFHVPIQANRDPDAARLLQRLTGPFILRRLKTDKSIIADLPDKLEMKVFCTLTKEQASLYEAVVEEASGTLDEVEGIQRKGVVLATLSKLKQVCNHPAQFLGDNSAIPGRSGKLARLTEMLEEALEAGDRALVFSQFSEMGAILVRHLEETFGREVLFLHGGTPKGRRDTMVERFQNGKDDDPRIFVLSLKAGGTGLNLTAANHVFHFDRWWNPAVEDQATDRAFRIGQARKVQVHKFVCVGTLEEKIDEMIEAKKEVAGAVVGGGEDWLTRLSTAELKELLALRREALAE